MNLLSFRCNFLVTNTRQQFSLPHRPEWSQRAVDHRWLEQSTLEVPSSASIVPRLATGGCALFGVRTRLFSLRHRKQPTWHNETMALGFKSKFSASSVASEYSSLGLKGCDITLDLARPTSTAQRRGWFPRLVTISVLSFPPTQEFWYIQMAVWVQEKLVLP